MDFSSSSPSRGRSTVALTVIVSLLAGGVGGLAGTRLWPDYQVSDSGQVVQPVKTQLVDESSKVIDAIEKVGPSVVSIVVTKDLRIVRNRGLSPFDLFFNDPFFNPFGQRPPQEQPPEDDDDEEVQKQRIGGGSGFIISTDGMVLTNRHVVQDEEADYTVFTSDGTEYKAAVLSRDTFNDLAILKIQTEDGKEVKDLPSATLGNSSTLKVGQKVIAIGNPLAEFENSATTGIISAKGRQIVANDGRGRGESLRGLLQTDAAINPGNSGGPLVNLEGEVIGVNTAIAQSAQGIGFAIPIDDVKPIITSVKEHGRIVRPILGVMYVQLTPELAKELELDIEKGALLKGDGEQFAVIPKLPADKAGLQERDVILEIEGVELDEEHTLQVEIMKHAPGDKVKLKIWRKGEILEKTVELGEAGGEMKNEK